MLCKFYVNYIVKCCCTLLFLHIFNWYCSLFVLFCIFFFHLETFKNAITFFNSQSWKITFLSTILRTVCCIPFIEWMRNKHSIPTKIRKKKWNTSENHCYLVIRQFCHFHHHSRQHSLFNIMKIHLQKKNRKKKIVSIYFHSYILLLFPLKEKKKLTCYNHLIVRKTKKTTSICSSKRKTTSFICKYLV